MRCVVLLGSTLSLLKLPRLHRWQIIQEVTPRGLPSSDFRFQIAFQNQNHVSTEPLQTVSPARLFPQTSKAVKLCQGCDEAELLHTIRPHAPVSPITAHSPL